jgi:hypothetical protein
MKTFWDKKHGMDKLWIWERGKRAVFDGMRFVFIRYLN